MKDYLQGIVQPLLSEPNLLEILESKDDLGVLLSLRVSPVDMGSIVGKGGETARAIRQIIRVFGARNKARVSVRFLEPKGGRFVKSVSETL